MGSCFFIKRLTKTLIYSLLIDILHTQNGLFFVGIGTSYRNNCVLHSCIRGLHNNYLFFGIGTSIFVWFKELYNDLMRFR
jgi:hypothetical protein